MEKKQAATQIFQTQESMKVEEEIPVQEPYMGGPGPGELGQEEIDGLPGAVSGAPDAPQAPKTMLQSEPKRNIRFSQLKTSEELQLDKEPIQIHETGSWFWRRIVVPPNAYVVHTRINKKGPVTLGMGVSFKYKKKTDSYLIVPAALQTIGVVANCISKEKQGINILAYVQWQIRDFSIAYRNLDFSDESDPLGIVNAQLREQAEAAIKDKIATMSVEEVLTDKAPVIEELTTRLREVTEGRTTAVKKGEAESEGLGIKITTVQIREAIVSSETLWRDLQSPYRHEQNKKTRMSYLESQSEIKRKELGTEKAVETEQAETTTKIEAIRQRKQTEQVDLRLKEEAARFEKEQASKLIRLQLEEKEALVQKESQQLLYTRENKLRLQSEIQTLRNTDAKAKEEAALSLEHAKREAITDVERRLFILQEEAMLIKKSNDKKMEQVTQEMELKKREGELLMLSQQQEAGLQDAVLAAKLTNEKKENEARIETEEKEGQVRLSLDEGRLKLARLRQEIRNLMNDQDLMGRLIMTMPQIAAELPDIDELKVVQTDNNPLESLTMIVSQIMAVLDTLKSSISKKNDDSENP